MPQTTAPTTNIAPDTMREVYEEVKTPFKHGVIHKGDEGKAHAKKVEEERGSVLKGIFDEDERGPPDEDDSQ